MGEHLLSRLLREMNLRHLKPSVTPPHGPVSNPGTKQPRPLTVAEDDLLDFDEDEDDQDEADDGDAHLPRDYGAPGHDKENTELVAAVFRAAGNPTFQDVRLRASKTDNGTDPTHRQLALEKAGRINPASMIERMTVPSLGKTQGN